MLLRKSLPSALGACLFSIESLLAILLLCLVPAAHGQVQFNGVAGVLAVNGENLGAGDHAAADPFGNVYISDFSTNQVFKVVSNGTATVAINNTAQINGMSLNAPGAVATDHNGNVYIADVNNSRIIYLPVSGTPTVLTNLGSGLIPAAIAVDFAGDVYVCLQNTNHVIEIQMPSGTPVGIGISPLTLNNPQGVAVDYNGVVDIADTGNGRVVKAVGGNATILSTGSISVSQPVGVTVDGQLNVYIADAGNNQVVEVPATGTPFVLGTGSNALSQPNSISFDGKATAYIMDQGNDRVVTEEFASVNFGQVAVGATGVTIPLTFTIDAGTTIGTSSITGPGQGNFSIGSSTCTNGTSAPTCTIQVTFQPQSVGPHKAAVVINNQSAAQLITLPLSGSATGPILAFSPGAISHYAGVYNYYCYCLLTDNSPQPAATAPLYLPAGMRVDEEGTLFFDDQAYYVIRAITPAGYISTVVGNDNPSRINSDPINGDGGPALNAYMGARYGIGLDGQDNVYLADGSWNEVREDTLSTGIVSDIAGNQYNINNCPYYDPASCPSPYTGDGGPAVGQGNDQVHINNPFDVTPDGNGNTYFSDNGNLVIRKIDGNGIITTVAGIANGERAYSGDGLPATQAQFYNPTTLVFDPAGDLIIGDPNNAVIREMTTDGIMHTVAGNHALGAGYTGDNGPATEAQISYPSGVALDGGGNMYIADDGNFNIRMVTTDGTISTVAAIGPCNPPNTSEMCYFGPAPNNGTGGGPSYAGPLVAQPYSIAAEANGNLFFADYNGNVIDKIDVADAPSLNFGTVAVSSVSFEQDVTIRNLGTAPMDISQFSIATNFTFGSDSTCNVGGGTVILAPGHSCMIGILFSPLSSGNISGAVTITSNIQGGITTIPLSGIATAQSQSINFPGLTNQSYSSAPITLAAVASSGLTVSYSVTSGLATVVGNQLTMTGVGAITVQATQTGNGEYTAATPVSVSFQVSPVMTPHPQSVLVGSPNTIAWVAGPADTSFELMLGTTGQGSNNLFDSGVITGTSVNPGSLPYNGAHIYATLRSNSAAMGWQNSYINYVEGQVATMASPAPGSTLTGSSANFSWNDGNGVTDYELWVGTTGVGSKDVLNSGSTTSDNLAVSNMPTTGATLYVRLFSMISGTWTSIDYTYTESGTVVPATITSPVQGSTLSSGTVTFNWAGGSGPVEYQLLVGSTGVGSINVFNSGEITATSATVTVPTNGVTLYVRLRQMINAVWQSTDYTYTESGTLIPATITSPVQGSTLTGSSVTFNWAGGAGPVEYQLLIGSTGAGSSNVFNSGTITATLATVTVPTNGVILNVRLRQLINASWTPTDYVYTESGTLVPATINSPAQGSTLTGGTVTFNWAGGSGPTEYALLAGSTGVGSSDVFSSGVLTATSAMITVPTNGVILYVRLKQLINAVWHSTDYTYTEFGTPVPAAITSPVLGSTLTGANITFNWAGGSGPAEYALLVGSSGVGSSNVFSSGALTATSATVTVPTNGVTLYVRLKQLINAVWHSTDYTYTEFGTPVPATITSPVQGSTLTSGTVTFNWAGGSGPVEYELLAGSTGVGSSNVFNSGVLTATSATVTVPTNGATLYVRLRQLINAVWQSTDYAYTESGTLVPATITSPVQGSTLTGANITFNWAGGSGPVEYALVVGSTGVGSSNVFSSAALTATSATVPVPTNGVTLYVRFKQLINAVWQSTDYTYTESGTVVPATINTPVPSSTFTSTSVTFDWSGASGPVEYLLKVGTTGAGSSDLYASGTTTATSATVTVPASGLKVYVRLEQLINGVWHSTDYTFTAS